jgi:hypothetical protein
MPRKRPTRLDEKSIAKLLEQTLSESVVDRIARSCRFLQRKREVTPMLLVAACVSALGTATISWLADIQRTFNRLTGKAVRYKPFHNQLAKPAFPKLFHALVEEALTRLVLPVVRTLPEHKLSMFRDIIAHDGSSFALKDSLASRYPGRFTKVSPAAVELHVTMSLKNDAVRCIVLAPDKEAERAFAPEPQQVTGCLLLEDRGYESRKTLMAIDDAGGFFIIRGNISIRPTIVQARDHNGVRIRHLEGKRLELRALPRHDVDLAICWGTGKTTYNGRLIGLYRRGRRNKKRFTYLHTNLESADFSVQEVGQLYRLRWQIELVFRDWKSHANLHGFDTSKAAIAEGLIWASLLAAIIKRFIAHAAERVHRVEISTQRVAAAARHFLDDILRSLLSDAGTLACVLVHVLAYLRENACRAHPERDRRRGRLVAGLRPEALA